MFSKGGKTVVTFFKAIYIVYFFVQKKFQCFKVMA